MFKTLSLVTAVALLVGVPAFAQDTTSAPAAPAPAAAPDNSSASTDTDSARKHHRHHHHMARESASSTDYDADKLNACMSSATPTAEQENCLRQAERNS